MKILAIALAHAVFPWLHEVILVQHNSGRRTKHCIECGKGWPGDD